MRVPNNPRKTPHSHRTREQIANVCLSRKRTFKFNEKHQIDSPLTAKSGHRRTTKMDRKWPFNISVFLVNGRSLPDCLKLVHDVRSRRSILQGIRVLRGKTMNPNKRIGPLTLAIIICCFLAACMSPTSYDVILRSGTI